MTTLTSTYLIGMYMCLSGAAAIVFALQMGVYISRAEKKK